MVVGLVSTLLSAFVARTLGPDNLGALSWGTALVALFVITANLGLDLVAVRLLSEDPSAEGRVLGSTYFLKTLGALGAFALLALTVELVEPPSTLAHLATYVVGLQLLLNPLNVASLWFQARIRTGEAARLRLIAFLLSTALKIAAIALGYGVVALAALTALEFAFGGLVVTLRWLGLPERQRPLAVSRAQVTELLRFGWPELVSGIAVTLYLKIDQVMLGRMATQGELGQYAAATRLVEATYAIPVIITGVVSPVLFRLHANDRAEYVRYAQRLHDAMFTVGLAMALPITLLATPICHFLFGPVYPDAPSLLALQAWSIVFVALNVTTGKLTHAEGLLAHTIYRQILGALLNIGLNLWMIPRWGPHGAAVATLISYGFSCWIAFLLSARVRHLAGYVSRSFTSPPRVARALWDWLQKRRTRLGS